MGDVESKGGSGGSGGSGVVHRILLIRHGETVDNIASLYAGSRDSALTNHGFQQATRLGQHLVERSFKLDHIFSSNLSRAFKTGEAIRSAQCANGVFIEKTVQLSQLREQDFGSLEGISWNDTRKSSNFSQHLEGDRGVETAESMSKRANSFLDDSLFTILGAERGLQIAVVAHGMILSSLWKSLLARQQPNTVTIRPEILNAGRPISLHHLGGWSNTGYLELEFRPVQSSNPNQWSFLIEVVKINCKDHLQDLKRTRGGVGSAAHDEGQRSIHSFFKLKRSS